MNRGGWGRQRRRAGGKCENALVAVRTEKLDGTKLLLATLVIEVFEAISVATWM